MSKTVLGAGEREYSWYRELNRYHWFVLSVACMGWAFDTMTQQLFVLGRRDAIRDLLGRGATDASISAQASYATSIFMIGWALGGMIFGVLGDRLGRAKTMTLTILFFTVFTGLSVFARGVWDFNVYRFLCGLGVGGQFGIGVALVAEETARPRAALRARRRTGLLQPGQHDCGVDRHSGWATSSRPGIITGAWRYMFLAGALPAPLALVVFRKLKEPEQWLKARAAEEATGLLPRIAPRRPALAAECAGRPLSGLRRRGGAVGHRLLQLRSAPRPARKDFPRRGLYRRRPGRQSHHLGRNHVPGAEHRLLFRH